MATQKQLALASSIASRAGTLMDAIRELIELKEEVERAGIQYAPGGTPVDFTGTSLSHTDGNGINNAITSAVALKTWLDTNFHSDNFDHVRA
jgi:hypothetical protein